jgi:hypothetical protein
MEAMHLLQLENNNIRESLRKLQARLPMKLKEEKTNFPHVLTNLLIVEPNSH